MAFRAILVIISLAGCLNRAGMLYAQSTGADTLNSTWSDQSIYDSLSNYFIELPQDLEYIPGEDPPALIRKRLGDLQNIIPLTYHERVHSFINYFTVRNREYTRMIIRRRDLYFPVFEKYLRMHNLPDELKYLSIIESGLNPLAVSRARAVGLWQFIYHTGRHYGLQVSWYEDQRMDPELATDAACRYLRDLYNLFNDWELALAAYNAGPGNVKKAVRRSGYKKTFWEIFPYLPRETRSYVPQFVAMVYTMNHLAEHNFMDDEREMLPPYDTLHVNRPIHFETLAYLTGGCPEDLQRLNPSYIRGFLPETGKTFVLRVPRYMYQNLQLSRSSILDSVYKAGSIHINSSAFHIAGSMQGNERIVHIVRSGETLSSLALRYRVRVADIQEWNNLRGTIIREGQRLILWAGSAVASPPVQRPSPSTRISLSDKTYTVQEGDTLWSITRKYEGLTVERIRQLNKLPDTRIYPGQVLVISE